VSYYIYRLPIITAEIKEKGEARYRLHQGIHSPGPLQALHEAREIFLRRLVTQLALLPSPKWPYLKVNTVTTTANECQTKKILSSAWTLIDHSWLFSSGTCKRVCDFSGEVRNNMFILFFSKKTHKACKSLKILQATMRGHRSKNSHLKHYHHRDHFTRPNQLY